MSGTRNLNAASENLCRLLSGLESGTRLLTGTAVRDSHGCYAVLESSTNEKIMCGFNTESQAVAWMMLNGIVPVRSDEDVLRALKLMELCEEKK